MPGRCVTTLHRVSELPAAVRLVDGSNGPVVEIDHAAARGTIHLHGAHLTSWLPTGLGEQLWLSPESLYGPDAAIRGGVPICFPWFAKGPGDWEPQHGFARRLPWHLHSASEDSNGVTVRLRLTDADVAADVLGRERWPYPFELEYVVGLGRELGIDLTVSNIGIEPFPIGGALHTYLRVPDITGVSLLGLEGAPYHDKVTETAQQQQGSVGFSGETDRVYASTEPVLVRDGTIDRVQVRGSDASHTVVWNPWQGKAATMADMSDDGWQQMLCIEAAVPHESMVELPPGHRWHLGQRITPASVAGGTNVGPGSR